jgi:hypothetical protein
MRSQRLWLDLRKGQNITIYHSVQTSSKAHLASDPAVYAQPELVSANPHLLSEECLVVLSSNTRYTVWQIPGPSPLHV